jgi:hypothetical protein
MEPDKIAKSNYNYTKSLSLGLLLFVLSICVNYFASLYTANSKSVAVTDIILSNFRVYDIDGLIISIALVLLVVSAIFTIWKYQTMPFVLKAVALFIVTRSVFISLTHLGPFTPQVAVNVNPILSLGLGNAADLFFSGHTGLPFLGALIFWQNKYLRVMYLVGSIILGISVLLGHLHYSIDVLAAFFITHTIFHVAKKVFPHDWEYFNSISI